MIQTCIIDVTNRCPLRCIGCFVPKKKKDMSVKTFTKIIKKLPEVKTVTLSGGEPFLNKNLLEFCKIIKKEKKCFVGILTSGNINIDLAPFKDFVDKMFVTIKYPSKIMDSYWRKNPNSLNNSKRFLIKCAKSKIQAGINWCADKKNYAYYMGMLRIARTYHVNLHILRFIPNDVIEKEEYGLSNYRWNKICKKLSKHKLVMISAPWKKEPICHAGIDRIGIKCNGDISPCLYTDEIAGNLLDKNWDVIQKRLEEWRWERRKKKGCLLIEDDHLIDKIIEVIK